jgi:hypothetical protein
MHTACVHPLLAAAQWQRFSKSLLQSPSQLLVAFAAQHHPNTHSIGLQPELQTQRLNATCHFEAAAPLQPPMQVPNTPAARAVLLP